MKNRFRTIADHGVCDDTLKRQFAHNAALEVARMMRRRKGTNHAEYLCRSCNWWHVGSTTVRRPHRRTAPSERWRAGGRERSEGVPV